MGAPVTVSLGGNQGGRRVFLRAHKMGVNPNDPLLPSPPWGQCDAGGWDNLYIDDLRFQDASGSDLSMDTNTCSGL